jgi:PAS domain S-box-containing protein
MKDKTLEQLIEEITGQGIFEAIEDTVSIQDTDFKVLYQNESAKRIIGDHIGKYCYRAFEGRNNICQDCPLAASFKDGKVRRVERRNPVKPQLIVEITTSVLKDSKGKIVAGIEVVRDIAERKRYEESLLIKNSALESSINAIAFADLGGKLTYVNVSFLEMWGYDDKHEVLGRPAAEFWQMEEKANVVIEALFQTGSWTGELIAKKKDGNIFDVQLSSSMVKDGAGNSICMMGSFLDISERKNAERVMLSYQNRLEAIAQIGSLANSTLNLADVMKQILSGTLKASGATVGMIFLVEPQSKTLRWGSSIGLSEDFIAEYSNHHIKFGEGLTGRIAESGKSIYIQRDSSHDPRIARSVIVTEKLNSFVGVPIHSTDRIVGVINILTRHPDILDEDVITLVSAIGSHVGSAIRNAQLFEEHKKAQEVVFNIAKGVSATVGEKFFFSIAEYLAKILEANYAYVAEIIKEAPNSVRTLALYADGKIIDNIEVDLAGTPCETVREKICSYSSGVQKTFPKADIIASMGVEGYVGIPLFGSSGERLGLMTVMYRRPVKNLEKVETMLRIFAARAAAELERRQSEEELKKAHEEIEAWNRELESRVREKTDELIKSQAQLVQSEKLSSIGQLAAGLAHELNSPLTGLISMTRQYRKGTEKDSKEYRELSLMLSACEYMAKIVKDFNTFSGKSRGEITKCNLIELIESSLNLITNELKLKNIQITKDHAHEHPIVKGDRTELQQVALNIITNAVDAMDDRGRLVIKTGISEDKSSVMMKFIDNGCGIKKENVNSIFEPFFTTKPRGKGTGLGLSVSYAIVKNHEGEIKVESEAGKGTEFEVLLPAVT